MEKRKPYWKITCDEAALICDKSQYKESSFSEKVKLEFHILFCKICKKYVQQNSLLSKIYKNHATPCKSLHFKMSLGDKATLKKEFLKQVQQ
jgi:hypothetical protein